MSARRTDNPNDPFEKMNRMYRHQRFFYDLTRKYYLLGRDRLLDKINPRPRENVLEIGCGTGRNLIILAKKFSTTTFFGLDASSEMLATARAKTDKAKLNNIRLKTALAGDFNYRKTFALNDRFDAVFFSYSISMIPDWKQSVTNALENLSSGGSLYIVDFYDQSDLPDWFQRLLKGWLKQFQVQFPHDLMPHMENLAKQNSGILSVETLYRHYAFLLEFEKK